jgi:predicted metal-binding protein
MTTPTTLFLCRICGQTTRDAMGKKTTNPTAQHLHEALQSELKEMGITVSLVDCLSVCTKSIAWGLRAEGKHAFTFAPASAEMAADIATTARTYHSLAPGVKMGKDLMPTSVKTTLISRLPPL